MDILKNKISTPFKAPESYFQELEDIVNLKAKLSGLNKLETVPENYFADLETTILSKTVAKKSSIFSVYKKPIFRYAASFLVIGFSAVMAYQTMFNDPIAEIASEDIALYLENEAITNFETESGVIEAAESIKLRLDTPTINDLSSEELENYIN
jgi:hypothetical protein